MVIDMMILIACDTASDPNTLNGSEVTGEYQPNITTQHLLQTGVQ
jgi:hypothetical protein